MKIPLSWNFSLTSLGILILGFSATASAQTPTHFTTINPGAVWPADDGIHIDAHGGNMLFDTASRTYYWYGEHYANPRGVACYASTDLYNWNFQGVVLARGAIPVLERPKVVYNAATRKYVMWFHYDQSAYNLAHLGVAVSDSPTGTFALLNHFRPNGHQSRDIGMFADDDGKVYILYAADSVNVTIRMVELSSDYQNVTTHDVDLGAHCEGPALTKANGLYYLITSQCSGWSPNQASYYTSTQAMGPYSKKGDPCVGDTAHNTFNSQSCNIFHIPNYSNAFMFMGDRWGGSGNANSRYVFLPLAFTTGNTGTTGDSLQLKWRDSWSLNVFTPTGLNPQRVRRARAGRNLGSPDRSRIPRFPFGEKAFFPDGKSSLYGTDGIVGGASWSK